MDSNSSRVSHPSRGRREVRGRLFDAIAETERQIARLHARQAQLIDAARLLGEADAVDSRHDSHRWSAAVVARREMPSELATTLRIPERAAQTLVARSTTLLHDLPATFASFRAGEIGTRHVQAIVEQAWSLPKDALPAYEAAILPAAETMTVAKLDRRARQLRERMHPESPTVRNVAARDSRMVSIDPAQDGMAWLNAYLPAETAAAAFNRATSIARSLQGAEETRTLAQFRADVLGDLLIDGVTHLPADVELSPEVKQDIEVLRTMVLDIEELTGESLSLEEMARLSGAELPSPARRPAVPLGTGRGIRAEVLVTVPVLSLLGQNDESASLEGHGPIDAETARRIAAHAPSFHRILTHPETGTVLSVGRDSYAVPKDLRRWLRVRDGTCRHPGCGRVASGCDVDHTHDWQYDGPTDHTNLAHLCRAHHNLKHHTGWSITQRNDGTLDWVSPTGRNSRSDPEAVIMH